jgi:hypothetical protein
MQVAKLDKDPRALDGGLCRATYACEVLLLRWDRLRLSLLGGFDLPTSSRRPFGLEAKERGADYFRLVDSW